MISEFLQRIARPRIKLALGLVAAFCLYSPNSQAQSTIQITNWDGTVFAAHAHLYTVYRSCYNAGGPPMPATICQWYLRKLYGDYSAVVVVIDAPHGSDPACNAGFTQQISSGYTRSYCSVYVTTAQYGN